MKVQISLIIFRIDVDFEGSNVDVILNDRRNQSPVSFLARNSKIRHKPNKKTPIADSIDNCFNVLNGDANHLTGNYNAYEDKESYLKKWAEKKVSLIETYGLCQGTCSMKFECRIEDYTPDMVKWVESEINYIFNKFIIYYK